MVLWELYNVSKKRVLHIEETEKRGNRTREKREQLRESHLEKEDIQERVMYGKEYRKERVKRCRL